MFLYIKLLKLDKTKSPVKSLYSINKVLNKKRKKLVLKEEM